MASMSVRRKRRQRREAKAKLLRLYRQRRFWPALEELNRILLEQGFPRSIDLTWSKWVEAYRQRHAFCQRTGQPVCEYVLENNCGLSFTYLGCEIRAEADDNG
jgi:hypothetical protein